ncbi:MAG TPA: thiamine pyrophosphate-binding protein [Pirellulales bacterium]|jgi:acetolactate synthase-1/2/3 large subunit|nr:thiamine pyrophosphate-binding protein [Pirellulales bacterium]
MAVVDGGTLVGRVLGEQKVQYLFSINGGHLFPILATLRDNGIKLIHMRHEQATAYAADGYARSSGVPGVCCVTAGCGLTNAVTGLCVAGLTGSSVVCLSGQHPFGEDGLGSFQEAYGAEICRTFSKFTHRVLDWYRISFDVRQAFREAMAPPQGVSVLEIPTNILYHQEEETDQVPGARIYPQDQLRAQGDPRSIERAVDLLAHSERPLIAGGDGIFWSQAGAELTELAELTRTPVYTRRAGHGALSEDHPLAVQGAWKKPFTGRADVVIAIGFRFWSGEKFGQPPTWTDKATFVQVDATPTRIGWQVPAEVAIVGDPKLVLRQMIDAVKARKKDFGERKNSTWIEEVGKARENFRKLVRERSEKVKGEVPIHPDRLIGDLASVCDPDATIVIDSFTLSGYISHWWTVRFPGQIVDAGPLAPVGHGIGMAIGAQLARPGKQVITVIGDGGLGIGGWDMETAAKYNIPIIAVLWNNSSWGPSFEQMPLLKGRTDAFDMIPGIRYDRIFKELGCHGEHVEQPDEIIPALRRAFESGKPAVINVVGDKRIGHPTLGGNLLGSTQV